MADYNNIIVEEQNEVAYVTINLPEKRNPLSVATLKEIKDALIKHEENEEIKCIVFTGKGDKAFASGTDINFLKDRVPTDVLNKHGMQQTYDYIEKYTKPTIAMINGVALGGGCELAIACDIRIATEKTKIGLPELNLGIIPSAGGTQRLSRLIGKGRAIDMILTGKILTGEEAERIGLVSESVKAEKLKEAVEDKANQIKSKGPLATRLAKEVIHNGYDTDMQTGLLIEKLAQALLFSTNDKTEGATAFLEKRNPDFKGK